nr:hypothetical protein [Tanacetum cinerariifolium]GFA37252.1 hypothetical protein [Tanacetum cinerariifolium]
LKDNPIQSSEFLTKSSSTSLNSFLEETNTFHNSFLKFENFNFDLGEISSGSTTTHSDISLLDYEAFYFDDDHIKEISSGSTTTHSDISLSEYDSFIFDFAHIIYPSEYDRFYFWNLPDPSELMSVLNSGIRENLSTTLVNLTIEDDHSPLLAYVVWIFLAYLTYPVIPPYLYPFGNEDTIFDPGITINRVYLFKPGLSHWHRAFKKFNTHYNEFIKSSVENLILTPSKSEGIPEHMCDVPFHDNSSPLDILKDQFEDFSESNEEFSSTDDDSFSFDKIDYVEASPPDSDLVSSEVMEIVIPKVGGKYQMIIPSFFMIQSFLEPL